MSDLPDFLLARIAEDEDAARDARRLQDYMPYGAWDLDRVLAECEAKRRIVEGLRWAIDDTYWVGDLDTHATGAQAERTLETLALPYADHPDYRNEWKS